jgi:DNA repair protein RecO (recombination protein O)
MPIQKSEAIVLRRQDLRETSLILTFYTKDFGKIKGIVRGVRGARSQSAASGGCLELFAHNEIVFYDRKNADIFTVSQCDLIDFFNPVRSSLERLSYASYMIELLDSVTSTQDNDASAKVFDLLLSSLKLLAGPASAKRVARIFEIKILSRLGLMPALDSCVLCGAGASKAFNFSLREGGLICGKCLSRDPNALKILPGTAKFMEHIRGLDFDKVERIKVAQEVGRELEEILRKFLDYHIERRLKTLEFIRSVEK